MPESLNAPKTVVKHFLNMARKHFSLYLEGKERVVLKKYFYVLIPLCSVWFMQQVLTLYSLL